MKIGITGGIGSGKSYVCRLLEARGISVYDCDKAAKHLMNNSPQLRQQLTELIGAEAYGGSAKANLSAAVGLPPLNKTAVTRFLMSSEDNAAALDAIVHPAVFRDFEESGMQWMESAILFESGIFRLVDKVVAVSAPDSLRLKRVMMRDGITEQKAQQWMDKQWPQSLVLERADYVIVNDGLTPLAPQIDKLLESLGSFSLKKNKKKK